MILAEEKCFSSLYTDIYGSAMMCFESWRGFCSVAFDINRVHGKLGALLLQARAFVFMYIVC